MAIAEPETYDLWVKQDRRVYDRERPLNPGSTDFSATDNRLEYRHDNPCENAIHVCGERPADTHLIQGGKPAVHAGEDITSASQTDSSGGTGPGFGA